jgi:hypothetical protein
MQTLMQELSHVGPWLMGSGRDEYVPLVASLFKLAQTTLVRQTLLKRDCAGTLVPFADLAMFLVSGGAGSSDLIVSGFLPVEECLRSCLQDPRGRLAT